MKTILNWFIVAAGVSRLISKRMERTRVHCYNFLNSKYGGQTFEIKIQSKHGNEQATKCVVYLNVKNPGTMRIFIFLFLAAVICIGCAHQHFVHGSGDAGQFILRQAIAHGGRPISTNSLPLVGEQWRYVEDQYGVIMRLPLGEFPAVESFLRQTFGEPSMPVAETIDGGKLGVYGVKAIGASIQFGYDKDATFVNILRPISMEEMTEHLPKALKEMEKGK